MRVTSPFDRRNKKHRQLLKGLQHWQEQEIKVGDKAWVVWGEGSKDPQIHKVTIKLVGRPATKGIAGPIRRVQIHSPALPKIHPIQHMYDVNGIFPTKAWAKMYLHFYLYQETLEVLEIVEGPKP